MVPRVSSYTQTLHLHLLEHRTDAQEKMLLPQQTYKEQRRYATGTTKTSNKLRELTKRAIILRGPGYLIG